MSNNLLDRIRVNLDAIEAIARELPAVEKRSELKLKQDEILILTEQVRRQAFLIEHITDKYAPDLTQLWGGWK